MAVRCMPGGRLAELQTDHRAQKRRKEDDAEIHPVYKYQVSNVEFLFFFISLSQAIPRMFNSGGHYQRTSCWTIRGWGFHSKDTKAAVGSES